MGYLLQGLFGERSLTKVAGLFNQQSQAENTMAQVLRTAGLQAGQVRLLGPQHAYAPRREIFSRSMEPEPTGMARTFFQSHIVFGAAGGVLGLGVFAWFFRAAHPMILSSPLLSFIALVGFGTTFGMLFAGLLSLRPDHIRMITHVRSALRHNHWAVVAHPVDPAQTEKVKAVLEREASEVLTTL